jgi:glucose-1-phosphate cytidylyltransferase
MKVVILAGGFGSRLSEETDIKPKPMVNIGGKPILWHIMKTYSSYGFNEFVILLGYKGYAIKEFFSNYLIHQSDISIDLAKNKVEISHTKAEPWKIDLLETGLNTMTGGRIKYAEKYVGRKPFLLTYGDGVADININSLVKYHQSHKKIITMTAVQPEGRYGALSITKEGNVTKFMEKPKGDGSWINGGYFVCEPEVFNRISSGSTVFEQEPLANLANDGELFAYKHHGFWACMDTLRDKTYLCDLWNRNEAPWKIWAD